MGVIHLLPMERFLLGLCKLETGGKILIARVSQIYLWCSVSLGRVELLTFGTHARSEGYCSCPVCVCESVHSFLPPRASRPRNIGTFGFIATRKNFYNCDL